MTSFKEVWATALPEIMKSVTGVGVWTALKSVVPITVEGDAAVLGIPSQDSELIGHLKLAQSRNAIETHLAGKIGSKVEMVVINGTTVEDWETEKRRWEERRKLQEQALERQKKEIAAGRSWETVYEQLSRAFASRANRSLPQNRARYFIDAVEIVVSALRETPVADDLAERNFARCIERIAQYTELPSTYVAMVVLQKSFEG